MLLARLQFLYFFAFPPQQLVEPVIFLRQHNKFILILLHLPLNVPHFLLPQLVALDEMTQPMYFRHFELPLLPGLPQLRSHIHQLILIFYSNLLDLPVYHRFPLSLELQPHLVQLLRFRSLQTGEPVPPFLNLRLQLLTSLLFKPILLLQPQISLAVFRLILLKLSVKLLAKDLHFLMLILHTLLLQFVHMTSLGQLPDLHLIALVVMQLPLPIFSLDSQHLNLPRQPFNLNSLEHNHKIDFGREILLLVTG